MPGLTDDLPACAGCGLCCHLVVELQPGDDMPAELVAVREGVRCMDQQSDGACIALDPATRLCTIYEHRPQTCRDFARGESLCRLTVERLARRPAVTALNGGTRPPDGLLDVRWENRSGLSAIALATAEGPVPPTPTE